MTSKKKGKTPYLKIEQILYNPKGWTKNSIDQFVDAYLEVVDQFKCQTGGGFLPRTEKEMRDENS